MADAIGSARDGPTGTGHSRALFTGPAHSCSSAMQLDYTGRCSVVAVECSSAKCQVFSRTLMD